VTEGCRPQNRLYYLDLQLIPKHPDTDTLDFSSFDFDKGVLPDVASPTLCTPGVTLHL